MNNVFCNRAEFGTYTQQFVSGDYVGIGRMATTDLAAKEARDKLYPLYTVAHPDDTSSIVLGKEVRQIARFHLEMKPGDYVITPAADPKLQHNRGVAAIRGRRKHAAEGAFR